MATAKHTAPAEAPTPPESASAPPTQPEAQSPGDPLSERLRQVAIRLGECHSAIALTARALVASESMEEQSEAAGWAADELVRVEADLDELNDEMTTAWAQVRRLEKAAAEMQS